MRPLQSPLFILHGREPVRTRIEQAAGRDFVAHVCCSWAELTASLRNASGSAVAVVDAYWGSIPRGGPARELRSLLRVVPYVPIVAALESNQARLQDVLLLGDWGVAEVLSENEAAPQSIAALLRSARARPLKRLIERIIPRGTGGRALAILREAADVSATGGQAIDLARRLHVSKRTLLRSCRAARLPPPKQLLPWMRVLRAAQLLDSAEYGVERIAYACGYAHDSGLRRVLSDFVGMGPLELKHQGALRIVSRAFAAALRQGGRRS